VSDLASAVSEDRLRADLQHNAAFGAVEREDPEARGRTVLTGSPANREARDSLVERLEAAGLDVRVDAVGTVVGRWTPESADPDAAPVAAGSHLDSVPEGGIFDGPLGVYAAVEAVRAMQDANVSPERPVEVVSFTEEEGQRFAGGLLGSSVAAGLRTVEDALALEDDGETLEAALAGIGYRGEGRVDASEWDAWLELHVEQDTGLEDAGAQAGVVTTITGIRHCTASIEGEANHAGATSMDDRTDALAAASEVVRDVERAARETVAAESETAVATVGSLDVRPNATNVVPGAVDLSVDIRDVRGDTVDAMTDRFAGSLARVARERGVGTTHEIELDVPPRDMAERCRSAAHDAADRAGVEAIDLHSGAAHDTMHVARVTDAGLLFAPSRDGVSHSPREWTDWADCAAATRVLAGALADLAGAD